MLLFAIEVESQIGRKDLLHPCMIKDPDYAYQKEVRGVWAPPRKTVEPLYIKVPDAIKYCRVIE